ncbi:DUF6159 family protein [Kutzneria chonburiensis]|uniref:DUF6159 family protein n=1 Tax=Kutzneria chonburiensis TaxID=1483604 RepID=A0ABV6MV41_9PSEU|nr:DUF6159 family protein [Kutzneria chonburiensis]
MRWAFDIARASLRVLRAHKSLVLFPIMSGLATLALLVAVLAGAHVPLTLEHIDTDELVRAGWPIAVPVYFVLSFVTIFCNSALVHAVNEALEGRPATVGVGLRGAWARIVPILLWSLLSCTVSLVLRVIGRQFGIVGKIVESLAGIAWALVTYFVVPVMIVDGRSVRDSVTRSRELLRKTWGAEVGGGLGISVALWGAVVLGIALLLTGLITTAAFGVTALIVALVAIVVWLVLVGTVASTVSVIYRVVLHRFATGRPVPAAFSQLDLSSAF